MKLAFCLLSMIFFLGSSIEEPSPSYDEMKKNLINSENEHLYFLNFMKDNNLVRVTYDSVYPKEKKESIDLSEFRRVLSKNKIKVGVQYAKSDGYFEIIYWSSGIVSGGQYKSYVYSEKKFDQIKYLQERIKESSLKCDHAINQWYICDGF